MNIVAQQMFTIMAMELAPTNVNVDDWAMAPTSLSADSTCTEERGECSLQCTKSCCEDRCRNTHHGTATGNCVAGPIGPHTLCICTYPCIPLQS